MDIGESSIRSPRHPQATQKSHHCRDLDSSTVNINSFRFTTCNRARITARKKTRVCPTAMTHCNMWQIRWKFTHISMKMDPNGSTPPSRMITAGSMNLVERLINALCTTFNVVGLKTMRLNVNRLAMLWAKKMDNVMGRGDVGGGQRHLHQNGFSFSKCWEFSVSCVFSCADRKRWAVETYHFFSGMGRGTALIRHG